MIKLKLKDLTRDRETADIAIATALELSPPAAKT